DEEHGHQSNETQHQVTIRKGFYLADTACTQALWSTVMEKNPSEFKDRPENPVDNVSWDECQDFISRANKTLHGQFKLRLPSESEWEYAARGGSQTAFWWGDTITSEQANYDASIPYNKGPAGEYREQTVDVLMFEANDFGLFNVHGNVREWCQDWYGPYPEGSVADPHGAEQGRNRVLRGGSWFYYPQSLRAADRDGQRPDIRHGIRGLRLAGG
ncbi:MAG: formylglycine-generating enzyme family protein, partial [Gammaproteobacteria bacterium]|nr:formylglycine-generating enzyme family protein [Gammaproteobacteria bacterium]